MRERHLITKSRFASHGPGYYAATCEEVGTALGMYPDSVLRVQKRAIRKLRDGFAALGIDAEDELMLVLLLTYWPRREAT